MTSPPRTLDFRSDTVTRPTAEMRKAMADAVVGDDVLGDDPTVKKLEALAAELCGKEAALYVPSGTMGNLLAVLVHTRPGDEAIMEERTHTFRYEGGCAARFGGVQIMTYVRDSGVPEVLDLTTNLRNKDDPHQPRSSLFVLENTHNIAGGRIVPKKRVDELADAAHENGLRMHIDGARIFNAATALGMPVSEIVEKADSVQFCLSKGLGAPVGSMICGSHEFRHEAHRARKALGGGMRQAGVIAAAGILALEEGRHRLHEDHARARRLGESVTGLPGIRVDLDTIETNMVMVELEGIPEETFVSACRDRGLLFFATQPSRCRFVTHRDLGDAEVEAAARVIQEVTTGFAKGDLDS